jgi:hypothetical protein
MSDVQQGNQTTTESQTQTATQPLGNETTVRDESGTIKDPAALAAKPDSTTSSTTTDPKSDEPKDKTKTEAATGAPEKYETFKAPEGITLDDKLIESAAPLFKELGLSQDQAQKLVDFHAAQTKAAGDAGMKAYEDMRADWRTKTASDKDLGNGTDLRPEVKANIGRALDLVPAEAKTAFFEAMDLTGAGDNPAVIRVINALAQRIGEGKLVAGGGVSPAGVPGGKARTGAQALFPHLPSSNG